MFISEVIIIQSGLQCSRTIAIAFIFTIDTAMATQKDIIVIDLVSSEEDAEVEIIGEYHYEELIVTEEHQQEAMGEQNVAGRGQRGPRGRGGRRLRRRRRQVTPASTSADSSIVSLPSPGRSGLREVVKTSEKVLGDITSSSSSSSSETTDEDFTQPPKDQAKKVTTPGSGQPKE